jgi:hypothetical protein
MLTSYYYNKQINRYIVQFANVFAGLGVHTGKGADGNITELEVPVVYSSKDRVVESIGAGNTQNRLHTLPLMSCYLTGIELAPERRKGVNQTDRRTYMPQGGVFLDDVKVAYRLMPVPFNFTFDLSIYVSNTDQSHQVLEQLLMLFDPTLQLQTSDAPLDWTKISSIELLSINNEENHPAGVDKRMIIWTLTFMVQAWISAPIDVRKNIIEKIILRYGDLDGFTLYEYNDAGEPEPFAEGSLWATDIIEAPGIVIAEPPPEDKV